MPPKLGIFVLCYNVASKIAQVIDAIPPDVISQVEEILIIDNHSRDETVTQAKSAVRVRGISKFKILKNVENFGYGGSHKVAFDYFCSRQFDYAILLHGDGQGDPANLRQIVNACLSHKYDLVMGSRFMPGNRLDVAYPWHRKWANALLTGLQSFISGIDISDPASPQMAYGLNLVSRVPYRKLTDSFHFTPQFVLYASRFRPKIFEFPMSWGKVEISSVNVWQHGWKVLTMLLGYRISGVRLGRSSRQYQSKPT